MKKYLVDASQAKARFSTLLDEVEKGEEITITKYGHPIAKLIPIKKSDHLKSRQQAIKELIEFGQDRRLAGLNWKKLRDQGR